MKKSILSAAAAGMVLLSSYRPAPHAETYTVDTKRSSIEWFAEKVSGKHNGTISLSKGEIKSDHGNLSGSFEADMKSMVNKDVADAQWRSKLESHLKSTDFFDAEKYPVAKFTTTSITPVKDPQPGGFTHTVKGNLEIKGKTGEITFDAVIKMDGNGIACVGAAMVDRSKFDIKYGSKTFFPEIGDKMINDEFQVRFNILAVKP